MGKHYPSYPIRKSYECIETQNNRFVTGVHRAEMARERKLT